MTEISDRDSGCAQTYIAVVEFVFYRDDEIVSDKYGVDWFWYKILVRWYC